MLGENFLIIDRRILPGDRNSSDFEGGTYNTAVSFIWVYMKPGESVRLHSHPYEEIFIIQRGGVSFTIGLDRVEAHPGEIIIVPAEVPHKFINSGDQMLDQIDIHVNPQIITRWLEE